MSGPRPLVRMVACAAIVVAAHAVASPASARARGADTLTVVSLNLWNDQSDWPRRLPVILAGLRAAHPDVVCLQEVLQNPNLRNQAQTLADSLGMRWQFATVDGPERPKRYGNAILTPHRVLASGARNLLPLDDYRAVAHVRLDWRGHAIDVYDTHLHHTAEGGAIRATQIRDLLAYVDSTRGEGPVVLAGDFNSQLGSPEQAPIAAAYIDAFHTLHPAATAEEAATYNPRFGTDPGAIDHVFVARAAGLALVPLACERLFTSVGTDSVWASDHFGLRAVLAVPPTVRPAHGSRR